MSTILEVARSANVSPSAVSLALNGRKGVSTRTRQRVVRAARELGYRQRPRGRPRKQTVPTTLALVSPKRRVDHAGRMHPLFTELAQAAEEAASAHGARTSLFVGARDIHEEEMLRGMIERGRIHGVILSNPPAHDHSHLDWLLARQVPLVVINRTPRYLQFPFVQVDQVGGGRRVGHRLAELGHRRVAYLQMLPEYDWSRQRLFGLRQGLAGHDAELAATGEIDAEREPEADRIEQVRRFCQSCVEQDITAVFCASDGVALMLLNACHELSIPVPERLSVVGFDDIGYRSTQALRPASIGYDSRALGEAPVEMLLSMIRQKQRPEPKQCIGMQIATYLVHRDTLAPPRGRVESAGA